MQFVTAAVGFYPSIPNKEGREAKVREQVSKISLNDFIKLSEFALKNNYFEFHDKIQQQISGTATGTIFAPPDVSI